MLRVIMMSMMLFASNSFAGTCVSKSGDVKIQISQGTMGVSGVNIEVGDFKVNTREGNLRLASRWYDENVMNVAVFYDPANRGSQVLLLKTKATLGSKIFSKEGFKYTGTVDIDLTELGKDIVIEKQKVTCFGNPFDV